MRSPTHSDVEAVTAQLGRPVRSLVAIAHRCPCGLPDVIATKPRLDDGTPFPTLYYLTCPRACSGVGRLEATGLMAEMTQRLRDDAALATSYESAHQAYLADRAAIGDVSELAARSAGGMPRRVKCLHALLAHSLAAGPGVNVLGDEVLDAVAPWWDRGRCVDVADEEVDA